MKKLRTALLADRRACWPWALVAAGPATAKDRNHDKIPDRWEKKHDLSLKVNQAKKDQDRDDLNNRGEYRSGSDPRDDDSDDDGDRGRRRERRHDRLVRRHHADDRPRSTAARSPASSPTSTEVKCGDECNQDG